MKLKGERVKEFSCYDLVHFLFVQIVSLGVFVLILIFWCLAQREREVKLKIIFNFN
jgi:hypothetical protein